MKRTKAKEKRSDITVLPIAPGTMILSGAMLLAFLILLIALNLNGMIDLPNWVERIIGTAESVSDDSDSFGETFLASLSGTQQNTTDHTVFIYSDPDALLTALMETEPAPSYYQSCTVVRTNADGASLTRQVFRLVSGGNEYTEILFRGQLERAVTLNKTAVRIAEQNEARIFPRTADSVFTAESEIGFPSLSRMKQLIAKAETGEYTLSLSATADTTCIRAEFTDTLSGTREVFDILPDVGVILAAQSYLPDADTPYYSLTTTSLLTNVTGFDNSIFEIPNS